MSTFWMVVLFLYGTGIFVTGAIIDERLRANPNPEITIQIRVAMVFGWPFVGIWLVILGGIDAVKIAKRQLTNRFKQVMS